MTGKIVAEPLVLVAVLAARTDAKMTRIWSHEVPVDEQNEHTAA